ncbi:amidase [Rhodobacter sp. NSM]|uniref:amidase n=1 Tax=Rhodobacter sp. NSM TaxID=3457501 RepID=UPI003FD25AEA
MGHADPKGALLALPAIDLRERLASGSLRAVELVEACLSRIAAREPEVRAWAFLDGDHALAQARALDARRQSGAAIGPLHGLPVGVKDVIDVKGMPTGSGLAGAGRVAQADAFVAARLRAAGAILIGKTATAEAAFLEPPATRNPHDPACTPGGSSSGSAAAVADGMVPLAIGTQTGGSVIRPAAFCGITGFKPSFGLIPRTGVLSQSPSLDTMGVFGRSVADVALLADALAGHDPADPATEPQPAPRIFETASAQPPVVPTLAFVRPPGWDAATEEMRLAIQELADVLGRDCLAMELPAIFQEASDLRRLINLAEMAHHYRDLARGATLSPLLSAAIEEGAAIPAASYLRALAARGDLATALGPVFHRCDAILCPAAPGPAPGRETTGDAIFNGLWTLCGLPAITLPVFTSSAGMPMGAQLVGPRGGDARLLRTARWLGDRLSRTAQEDIR